MNALDTAIEKSTLPADAVVYRGISSKVSGRLLSEGEFTDMGFQSTSLDPNVAIGYFSKAGRDSDGYANVMRMKINEGDNGIFTSNRMEAEVILPRGTSWKVDSITVAEEFESGDDFYDKVRIFTISRSD